MLIQAALLAALGLVLLVVAGDFLVRGAVNMALRVGIPALIVSLTVVAFGTSAPELITSIDAVLSGVPDIALGNVVGSNIANILLVLGVPAAIAGLHCSVVDTRRSYVQMLAGTVLFLMLAQFGQIGRIAGLILLAALAVVLFDQVRDARAHRRAARAAAAAQDDDDDDEEVEGANPDMRGWKIGLFLALGLVGLPIGAGLLVENAAIIATHFGVSEAVIGLTLVALGTSLPELATSVSAALRNQSDVALGNVIGSNLFNLLAILGITSLIAPIPVAPEIADFDLWAMLVVSLMIAPFVLMRRDIGRLWGVLFCLLYVVYIGLVLI
ncbi:calcium/sodium antiporter [Pseudooceanicola sp. LIPI14-2-Ac024]|uniref:calcium/sodium antiporter n=1 Tax=Pseudooceanicola sp. LIPI14-2-Ac024 TaxID=3344875 RepID=UPI0035CFCEFB